MSTAASYPNHTLVVVFDTLVLLGVILFSCTLLPAIFSRTVQRSFAWYSLMTAWLVYSLSYGLLVGRQEGPEPPLSICLTQTLFIYAVPALAAVGMLCYYIEFCLLIFGLKSGQPIQPSSTRNFWLVASPWLTFLGVIVEVLLLVYPGGRLPKVQRTVTGFYCHLGDNIPNLISASIVFVCMAILIPLEVWTGTLMRRNWDAFKRLDRQDRRIVLAVYLRLSLCTLAAILAFTLSTLAFVPGLDAATLAYPTLPIFIALAFGTQKDLLQTWLFWRPSQHTACSSLTLSNGPIITTNIISSPCGDGFTETQLQQQSQKQSVAIASAV